MRHLPGIFGERGGAARIHESHILHALDFTDVDPVHLCFGLSRHESNYPAMNRWILRLRSSSLGANVMCPAHTRLDRSKPTPCQVMDMFSAAAGAFGDVHTQKDECAAQPCGE